MRRLLPLLLTLVPLLGACQSIPAEPIQVIAATAPFDQELFTHLVNALKAECPVRAPTYVGVVMLPRSLWGRAGWNPHLGIFIIHIEARQPMYGVVRTLIHEWAHVMVMPVYQGHGPLWGVAYAHAYRVAKEAALGMALIRAAAPIDLKPEVEAGDPSLGPCNWVRIEFPQQFALEHAEHERICTLGGAD